jgi:hypothetical protein
MGSELGWNSEYMIQTHKSLVPSFSGFYGYEFGLGTRKFK